MIYCKAAAISYALIFAPVYDGEPTNSGCFAELAWCQTAALTAMQALALEAKATGYGPHYIARCETQPAQKE